MELALWAILLFAQNFTFTFVSRARNSASLKRHLTACLLSNGIFYFTQLVTLSANLDIVTGKHGTKLAVIYGLIYTIATAAGSITSHYWALKTEKGLSRVGAYEEKQSK